MVKVKYIYTTLVCLLFVLTFSSFVSPQQSKPGISGKWYHQTGGVYYKDVDRKDISRWYEFKGSTIIFSSCTDWCGCMRETVKGKYKWIDNNTIEVTYTHSKYWQEKTFKELKDQNSVKLEITKEGKGLRISKA